VTRKTARKGLFKPGFAGAKDESLGMPGRGQAIPDEGAFDALEQRIHRAMLTLTRMSGDGPSSRTGFWPDYVVELADRIEREKEEAAPPRRFRPTGTDVDDLLPALELLQGLRVEYFQLVRYKAVDDFRLDGGATWVDLGDSFGRSDYWARESYRRAMLQAAKRAGLVFSAPTEYAVVWVTVMYDGLLMTWIGTSSNPRQTLYDKKAHNPAEIVDCSAVWVADKATAKVVLDQTRAHHTADRKHGGWHILNPFDAEATIMDKVEGLKATWRMEYLAGEPIEAPVRQTIEDVAEAAMMSMEGDV
jgi:hypothetical protein